MSTLAQELAEDQRLILLRCLHEAQGAQLNETILRLGVNKFGHQVGRDVVRNHLNWLEEQRLVRLEKLPTQGEEFWVAHLLPAGEEVVLGRKHPGVARRLV